MNSRRTVPWLLAALVFGLLLLPLLVHLTGVRVLGPYPNGGVGAFFADYLRGLATFRWYSWVLLLGPVLIVLVWRMLTRVGKPAGGS